MCSYRLLDVFPRCPSLTDFSWMDGYSTVMFAFAVGECSDSNSDWCRATFGMAVRTMLLHSGPHIAYMRRGITYFGQWSVHLWNIHRGASCDPSTSFSLPSFITICGVIIIFILKWWGLMHLHSIPALKAVGPGGVLWCLSVCHKW